MGRLSIVGKIRELWQSMTIRQKIGSFTGVVFLIIVLSVLFDFWVVRFSLSEFNNILDENAKSSAFLDAMEEETVLFEDYIKNSEQGKQLLLESACQRTKEAVEELPFEYATMDQYRYAKTWSIRNSYAEYAKKRDQLIAVQGTSTNYIKELYAVYGMQEFLQSYARILMHYTIDDGSTIYQRKIPVLNKILWVVVVFGTILLAGMLRLTDVLNRTIISPVMKLVGLSKRIAGNDFTVPDVEVESQDELGELVSAFNKMKYATGEYILALEEKRAAMDLLHAEELERLDVERRLETIRLEMLQNQINPHFLFNTLNVIAGMAKLEESKTTEKMIKALSTLFRYNLKTTAPEVALGKELHVVKEYMYLQKMRFGDRIQYEIECSADEEETFVPSFTFQPLVENAILHGLANKEEGGKITLRIWQRREMLCIIIADTGKGMDSKSLELLREKMEEGSIGIGLGNVYKRVTGMYAKGSVTIASTADVGTVVKIKIPQSKRGGAECIEY